MTATLKWRDNYVGLPDLPIAKLWKKGGKPGTATDEQIITNKLLRQRPISTKEENLILDCILYYQNLLKALEKFKFSELTREGIEIFCQYIGYAYNYLLLHSNEIELYQTFRLVENCNSKTKQFSHQLSYPPLEIVKEKDLFNRASSLNSTVFYSSESVDTAFKELRPKVGSIVTLGIWGSKGSNKFLSYPISSNSSAEIVNDHARITSLAYKEIKRKEHPLLREFMDGYFNLLNHEFSKTIQNKKEYLVSSYFSEKIFEPREKKWNYDCIIYPSVGNEFSQSNFAFKAEIAKSRLELKKAFELEILETFYDKPANKQNSTSLTVVKARLLKQSKEILENGEIQWV